MQTSWSFVSTGIANGILLPESTDGLGVPVLCVAAKLDDVALVAVLSGWLDMAHVSNFCNMPLVYSVLHVDLHEL